MSNFGNFCCDCKPCPKTGGVKASGKASVSTNQLGSGFIAILPLNEIGQGIEDEYQDITNNMHGTGGTTGDLETVPLRATGFACQFSQYGNNERQFIVLPTDNIAVDHEFSLSCWINLEGTNIQNPIFCRGESFQLYTSVMNHIMATVETPAGPATAYSTIIEKETWYHVGVSWDTKTLSIYINGVLQISVATPAGEILDPMGRNFIGKASPNGRGFSGRLQEFRLSSEARTPAWFLAEYANYCSDFFEVF